VDFELSGVTVTRPVVAPACDAAVPCDQAIFTSVRTPMGEGYRIIAASAGLKPEEKTAIAKQSPSHGGLCGSGEETKAVAFYKLPGGRLCAALSCTAGKEHSGRGGLRIYTRAVVFDGESFCTFAYNPFNVFRVMESGGLGTPELKPEKTPPGVQLPTNPTKREEETAAAVARAGVDWLGYILRAARSGERLVVACEDPPHCLVEAVFLGIPAPMRQNVSLACGLKFSIGRAFILAGVTGDTAATERIIRGHPVVLVRPNADGSPPKFEYDEWQRMVSDHWTEATARELQEFTARVSPDCSPAALERIAALRNDARRVATAKPAGLLQLVARRLAQADADELECNLRKELAGTIRMRLERIWSQASETELTAHWPALLALAPKSPEAFRLAVALIGLVLRRLAVMSPVAALECTQEISHAQVLRAINADLRDVRAAVERWLLQADPSQARHVEKLLAKRPGTDGCTA